MNPKPLASEVPPEQKTRGGNVTGSSRGLEIKSSVRLEMPVGCSNQRSQVDSWISEFENQVKGPRLEIIIWESSTYGWLIKPREYIQEVSVDGDRSTNPVSSFYE